MESSHELKDGFDKNPAYGWHRTVRPVQKWWVRTGDGNDHMADSVLDEEDTQSVPFSVYDDEE